MAALKLAIMASVSGVVTKESDISDVRSEVAKSRRLALLTGTAAGQANLHFADTRTLAASASEDLDLAGGLTDPFGQTLTFAKVKAIMVLAAEGNANDILVGGAASNAFVGPFADATDKIKVRPGGIALLAADGGWTVTAATGDILKIANAAGGSSVTYDIIIIGTDA